ncbi:MAG: outer membrane protein assembly factor BamD [PVC group bacterium]
MTRSVILIMLAALSLSVAACGGVEVKNGETPPETSLVPSPEADLLWNAAQALETEGDRGGALNRYQELVDEYPDSPRAPEAQFRIGVCLEAEDDLYEAFEAYQLLLDEFPGKGNLGEILSRQYAIGEAFLNGRKRSFLFLRIRSGLGAAEEIFRTVVNNATFSTVSPLAQYGLGRALQEQGDYEEAITEYEQVLANYPGTDVIPLALFKMGDCYYQIALQSDYDPREVDRAIQYLEKFAQRFPDHQDRPEAERKIAELVDLKAEKAYDIARFYESEESAEGGRLYYQEIVDTYPDSSYALPAREKLAALPEPAPGTDEGSGGEDAGVNPRTSLAENGED